MAKLDLREGEELIEQAAASHVKKVLIMPQANPGNLFVTNQRVVFRPTQGRPSSQFEYELSDLRSFSVAWQAPLPCTPSPARSTRSPVCSIRS